MPKSAQVRKPRQAPVEHASDHVNEYRKGQDGNMWFSSPTAKRWIRTKGEVKHHSTKGPKVAK
jgi:hypothetical protein